LNINVHYSGKIVEYQKPRHKIEKDVINKKGYKRYIQTAKQEILITDAIFYALHNPKHHIYLVTLTYRYEPQKNYGFSFRKQSNKHLNEFIKFLRESRDIYRYVGVLELTKNRVPHYHIILDADINITSVKAKTKKKSKIIRYEKKLKRFKQKEECFFFRLQNKWNRIRKDISNNSLDYKLVPKKKLCFNGGFIICKYLTKYFTKELKIPKEQRFDYGVRNYFISDKLRIKPINLDSSSMIFTDFIEIQRKARKKHHIYWNFISKNDNWSENINYYKDTASYYVSPYALPPLTTFISKTTLKKPFKTLYDRIKYIESKTNKKNN